MKFWRPRRRQQAAGKHPVVQVPQPPPPSPSEPVIRLALGVPLAHPENVVTEYADIYLGLLHGELFPNDTDSFIIQEYLPE